MESAPPPIQNQTVSTRKVAKFVIIGCLGLLLVVGIFITALLFGVSKMMKSNDAFAESIAAVQSNPEAIEALGEPIEPGFFVSGSINYVNGKGTADLSIPVSGPKAKGQIKVIGKKANRSANWIYSKRSLKVKDQANTISLMP